MVTPPRLYHDLQTLSRKRRYHILKDAGESKTKYKIPYNGLFSLSKRKHDNRNRRHNLIQSVGNRSLYREMGCVRLGSPRRIQPHPTSCSNQRQSVPSSISLRYRQVHHLIYPMYSSYQHRKKRLPNSNPVISIALQKIDIPRTDTACVFGVWKQANRTPNLYNNSQLEKNHPLPSAS